MTLDKSRAYYKYNSALIEPWDGPALIAFTDGEVLLPFPTCTEHAPPGPLRHQAKLPTQAPDLAPLVAVS